jgi:leucyl aminopeptidase
MTSWSQLRVVTSPANPTAVLTLAYSDTGIVDKHSPGVHRLTAACAVSGFGAELGGWLDVIGDLPGPQRSLILGLGTSQAADPRRWITVGGFLFDAMLALRLSSVQLPSAASMGSEERLEHLMLGALLHSFRAGHRRARPKTDFEALALALVIDASDASIAERVERIVNAVNRARAWVEWPANLLTPPVFAAECQILEQSGARVRVLETDELDRLGAGGIIAVGRGAEHGPNLVVAEWRGNTAVETWDAVLVGKGLTYDGGGLNLKSAPVIEKMKFDMAGAAAVLGAVELAAARKVKCNVAAVVPLVENAIDARAYRPGDVISSLSGLTIEVINTDAEGRIVVADALTYGLTNYHPRFIVDVATLTGAMTSILHEEFAGCYATDDLLADALIEAGEITGERVWRLPLDASQDYLVESAVADVANLGAGGFLGLGGRSPTAGAKFLQRFVGSARWAHLDIAGTAMSSRRTSLCGKGATGFGVRLLDSWLSHLAA